MGKTVAVFTCAHADPGVSNTRAEWLGQFLFDLRPDYVVDLGDTADLRSLNSYDTTKPTAIVSQNYERDLDSYGEFQEKVRWKFRQRKVKRPSFFGLMGNHEYRIQKAIDRDPRLEGDRRGISMKHLEHSRWYDEYHPYEYGAPAIAEYDGVSYAHFISSGNYGTAMSGEHHAYNLLKKKMKSCTVGHSHKRNVYFRDDAKAIGLVAGCFKGAKESWAGQANDDWAYGVWIKRNVVDGYYEPQWISLESLKKEYGG